MKNHEFEMKQKNQDLYLKGLKEATQIVNELNKMGYEITIDEVMKGIANPKSE